MAGGNENAGKAAGTGNKSGSGSNSASASASASASGVGSGSGSGSGSWDSSSLRPLSLRSSTLQSLIRGGVGEPAPAPAPTAFLARGKAKAKAKGSTSFTFAPSLRGIGPAPRRGGLPSSRGRGAAVTAGPSGACPPITGGGSRAAGPPSSGSRGGLAGSSAAQSGGAPGGVETLLAHRLAVLGSESSGAGRDARRPNFYRAQVVQAGSDKNKLAQYELLKRRKNQVKNKSREIAELSFPPEKKDSALGSYTPISLPYVSRATDQQEGAAAAPEAGAGGSSTSTFLPVSLLGERKSQRPTVMSVDESNRSVAELFEEGEGDGDESGAGVGQWILLQFPSQLPAMDKEKMSEAREKLEFDLLGEKEQKIELEKKRKEAARKQFSAASLSGGLMNPMAVKYRHSSLPELPEGRLGKLIFRKSGKVQLRLGKHVFDVNQGSECNFAQEVACYVDGNSEFFNLGRCFQRAVITPSVDYYLT